MGNPEIGELARLELLHHHPGRVLEVRGVGDVPGCRRVAVAPRGRRETVRRQEREERRVLRAKLLVGLEAEELGRLVQVRLRPDVEHGQRTALRVAGLREREIEHDDRQRHDHGLRVDRERHGAPVSARPRPVGDVDLERQRLVRLLDRPDRPVPRNQRVGNDRRAEVDEVPEARQRGDRAERLVVDREADFLRAGDDDLRGVRSADRLVEGQRLPGARRQLARGGDRLRGRVRDDRGSSSPEVSGCSAGG